MELQNKTYHHGNLREALLDAALEQLRENGTDTLSLRALARSVGVSQTAPYRHFADKSDLLAALAASGHRRMLAKLDALESNAQDSLGPEHQIYRFAHCYVEFAANNPELFKLMFGPALQAVEEFPELHQAKRETFDRLRQIIRSGIQSKVFRPLPVDYLANIAWSSVHGLATVRIDMPLMFETRIDLRSQTDLGVGVFLAGIANPDQKGADDLCKAMLQRFTLRDAQ